MKTSSVGAFVSSLLLVAISASAQSPSTSTSWQISEKGPHHRVWERTEYEPTPDGRQVPRVHRYTELAMGLNYKNPTTGEWEESKEEIQLLPNGAGASAGKGQHKAIFPANILEGKIELNTPEGQWLRSQILGLAYFDSSSGKSVLIAELKSSAGEIHSPNVVLYPDAFTDIKADVRYTYTRAGFEQDIVLREQPPGPAEYGLNPETTKIEVLTEFFNPPQPVVESINLKTPEGITLPDQTLQFGVMSIGHGKAFSQDKTGKDVPVAKQWLNLEGRDFLIEEVSMPDLKEQLQLLPAPEGASLKAKFNKLRRTASIKRELPSRKLAKMEKSQMKLASMPEQKTGFVLDYTALTGYLSNYVFRGDTTYHVSGAVYVQLATFEGGTVIKYASGASMTFLISSPPYFPIILSKASPYRPIILTAKDDNTVGEPIAGSTGNPAGYYADPAVNYANFGVSSISFPAPLRVSYAKVGVQSGSAGRVIFSDVQFVRCEKAFSLAASAVTLQNALFANVQTNFDLSSSSSVDIQNGTFSGSKTFVKSSGGDLISLLNCVLANVTNLNIGGASLTCTYGGFYKAQMLSGTGNVTNTFYPFQTAGGGQFYLVTNCSFRGVASTNAITAVRKKTTSAPVAYENLSIANATNWGPQVSLDVNGVDMGYHYERVDYVVSNLTVLGANLLISPGAVIAASGQPGIILQSGGGINSTATPTAPNWFVYSHSVQEQPAFCLGTNGSQSSIVSAASANSTATFRFTKFAGPAGAGYHIFDAGSLIYGSLTAQDCEFWGGLNDISGSTASASLATLKNNLFWRSSVFASNSLSLATLSVSNNLFWTASVTLNQPNSVTWKAFDNSFDSCVITNTMLTNGYNAYLGGSGRASPTYAGDYVQASTGSYVSNRFGEYYQNGANLVNKGSGLASSVALYHYTTQSSQTKETNSVVDIGYHYVAADSRGYPLDLDGDGIPDYLEDANGNGVVDAGETSWFVNNYNGLTSGAGLQVFTPLK